MNELEIRFERSYGGEKVILFGASKAGRVFLDENKGLDILCFCDNDPKKWGTSFCGYEIIAPAALKEINEPIYIIITSEFVDEIYPQLEGMGFAEITDSADTFNARRLCSQNEDKIKNTLSLLGDEKSKSVFAAALEKRKLYAISLGHWYADIVDDEPQYFNSILKPAENEIYVDAGAYGNSLAKFIEWTDGNYERAYCFEPAKDSFEIFSREVEKMNIPKEKCLLFEKGLYSENKTLNFSLSVKSPSTNHIANEHDKDGKLISIEAVKLDDFIGGRVTFIKMDIEGAEFEAIKGAENIIKTYKPKLAISLYHKITDFWEIPLEIHRLCPEYRLYVRHHHMTFNETVLYATI